MWNRENDTATLYADNTVTIVPNPGAPVALTDALFVAQAGSSMPSYTGIQIFELSSDITNNVTAGAAVTFTVNAVAAAGMGPLNYRFYIRKGYEQIGDQANPWGGNTWELEQNWSPSDSASITFSEPGFYFVAVHCSEDTNWSAAAGGPQTGIVVEVWPAQ